MIAILCDLIIKATYDRAERTLTRSTTNPETNSTPWKACALSPLHKAGDPAPAQEATEGET